MDFVYIISYNHTYSILSVAIKGKQYNYRLTGEFQYRRFCALLRYNQGRALVYVKKVGKLVTRGGGERE